MENTVVSYLDNFRKEIISLRKANKLTQKAVAEGIGVKTQCYQAYESGVAVPTIQNFIKLAIFFEITPNELFEIE